MGVLMFNDGNNKYIPENINTAEEAEKLIPILDNMFREHLLLQKQYEGKDGKLIEINSFLGDIGLPHASNETWGDALNETWGGRTKLKEDSSKKQGRF